jgi:hypothetical protein
MEYKEPYNNASTYVYSFLCDVDEINVETGDNRPFERVEDLRYLGKI